MEPESVPLEVTPLGGQPLHNGSPGQACRCKTPLFLVFPRIINNPLSKPAAGVYLWDSGGKEGQRNNSFPLCWEIGGLKQWTGICELKDEDW